MTLTLEERILADIREDENKYYEKPNICCPACSHTFTLEDTTEVIRGSWKLSPDTVNYQGRFLRLTPQQIKILYELAINPRPLKPEYLHNRVSNEEADDPSNSCAVQISRIRVFLKKRNIPDPIKTRIRLGYQWSNTQ